MNNKIEVKDVESHGHLLALYLVVKEIIIELDNA